MEEKVVIGKPDPNAKALANVDSAVSATGSKNSQTNVAGGDRSSQEKSVKGLGANRGNNKTDMVEEYNQKILKF